MPRSLPALMPRRWQSRRLCPCGGRTCVCGVAQPGCITGVVGASGSGKTVLLRTLAGHSVGIVWEAGEIVVGDVPVQALREENKAAVLSFLPTAAPIRGDLSVEDNINYCGALLLTNATEDEYSQALEETLEGLMLTDVRHQKAASLSQGQALRMRLAQLMIAPTRIVLLDDPLRGIDEAAGVRILKYLKRVAQEKQIAVVCAVGTATSLVSAVLDTTLELESGRVQDDLERAGNTHNTINSSSTHNNNSNSTHNKCDMNGVNGKTNDKQHAAGAETASSLPTTAKAAGVGLAQLEALHRPVASVKQQVHSLALLYMKEESPRALNKYKAVVAIGLGLVTGILWFGVGVEEDRRSFGETVSLLFAAMITWIIAFVYPAAAGVKSQYLLLRQDVSGHFYSYWLRLVVWTVFDFAVLAVWPIVFGTITFTLAYVGADWESNLTKSFILALAANVFHALGLLLGAAIPDPAAAVAVVTVVVQAMLMMAGFYRTLPDAIQWLPSVIGIPYYILTALMRTEFSANDSYRCHPSRASSAVGPHDCYIETNLLTEDYRQRNILFVQSPEAHDPSEWALVLPLVLFYIGIRILGAIILLLRIRRKFRLHAQQKLPSDHRRSSTHASSGAAPVRREPETKALISCTHSNGTATENGHCTKQRPSHHQRRASQKQLLLEDEANGDAMDGFSGPHTDVSTV
ncbi:hypothetical protein PTSG_06175 [Salpingoeca rosetta]|uniref:ABC transporter domain-containing protein n=1 Tax=Salpingoeca rosetta (strain ATCC 50818 / BSB-021) TaxID=946362 RepID=F2UC61_SALR5|nr:uncharacterized protein PTSG_06175 [Salpingoeca rosetta]EGD74168.1 hypothetical protein PTSG_06175 [Salpingoeca rosetta]|eukprot:XP_004993068.1 hypothetical protein PTSG_06175 [Salpingoeca rosetta]